MAAMNDFSGLAKEESQSSLNIHEVDILGDMLYP